jgi:pimeloyl-ACP methyl ester carboxylesterase
MSEGVSAPPPGLPELRSAKAPAEAAPGVDGIEITYREAGAPGHPVLMLLHGIGSSSMGFIHQFTALADMFRVLAWDAPGYGRSEDLGIAAPDAADYAAALLALLDRCAIRRIHLLGSSLGALVAAAFAARHPDRLSSLILSSPAMGHARLAAAEREAKLEARLAEADRPDSADRRERRARALVAHGAAPEALTAACAQLAPTDRPGYGQAARMLSHADIRLDIARIALPTLIVSGRQDRVTPIASCAAVIHAAMPGSTLEIVEGAGHLVHLERPAIFNALLREFVQATAGQAGRGGSS